MKQYAKVAVSGLSFWVDKEFTYSYDENLKNDIFPGSRVVVPFGRGGKKREGIVTGLCDDCGAIPLKSIFDVEKSDSFVLKSDIELARYMARKYYSPLYDCLVLMSLPGSGAKFREFYEISGNVPTESDKLKIYEFVKEVKKASFASIEKLKIKNLKKIIQQMILEDSLKLTENIKQLGTKTVQVAYITDDTSKIDEFINAYQNKAKAQIRLIEALSDFGKMPVSELVAVSGTTRASVKALEEKELITVKNEEIKADIFKEEKFISKTPHTLNDEQKKAVDTLKEGLINDEYREYLIKGVTGSGKTEIYLSLCDEIIKRGEQAIILVPEISLTPQIRLRFFGRFGDKVAVLHSALSISERRSEWNKIKKGEVSVVVGARSAVFAPFSKLKMIIIDEEHETSYKSDMTPRYDAKDIARYKMQKEKGILVLSSATPSICSYYNTTVGKSTLITLNKRYNKVPLPKVETVDMRNEIKEGNHGVLSKRLEELLLETKEKGEKSILLLNRRGYSTFISCRDCGYVVKCPKCEVALTYHNVENRLKCHYCQTTHNVPSVCPECGSASIRYFGSGTQKLEEELYKIFPEASVIRMDNDTTTAKMSHERLLNRFEKTKGSILVGTQMIAKGLDFKDVSLVGVVAADSTLFVGGFYGNEKTFSLITQVCGRAGRGEKQGNAVIQTYQPDHYAIEASKTGDYNKFYENEIIFRKNVKYPPFCEIINIVFTSDEEKGLMEFADSIKPILTEAVSIYPERQNYISMYGPMPCAVSKIGGKYRIHLTVKCTDTEKVRDSLGYALCKLMPKAKKGVSVYVDVNPTNFI